MPWTPDQFAARHNKQLSGGGAAKAASIANAVLRQSGDEGKAIRIANAAANGTLNHKRKQRPSRHGLDTMKGDR